MHVVRTLGWPWGDFGVMRFGGDAVCAAAVLFPLVQDSGCAVRLPVSVTCAAARAVHCISRPSSQEMSPMVGVRLLMGPTCASAVRCKFEAQKH